MSDDKRKQRTESKNSNKNEEFALVKVGDEQPKKKSRWGNKTTESTAAPKGQLEAVTQHMTADQKELYIIRCRIAELNQKIVNPIILTEADYKSPSPEPEYDANGVRSNMRPQRIKQKYIKERAALLERASKLCPLLPMFNYPMVSIKPSKKLFIPQDKHPSYNFIGLIIGPRGNTQKRMEKETGTKISIRGKGAHKSGKNLANKGGKPQPGDDEPLHVLITGDTQDSVDKAGEIVQRLLTPLGEEDNLHKARQLRELAQINGTASGELVCRLCNEKGHKMQDCPNRTVNWKPANVLCSICGSATHPEADCPTLAGESNQDINNEYANFMREIHDSDDFEAKEVAQARMAAAAAAAAAWGSTGGQLPGMMSGYGMYPDPWAFSGDIPAKRPVPPPRPPPPPMPPPPPASPEEDE